MIKIIRCVRKGIYLLLLTVGMAGLLAGCSDVSESQNSVYNGKTPDQVFAMGDQYMVEGEYSDAVKAFEHLEATYPFGPHAQQTELNIIYAYYMNSDPVAAKAAAERYIHLYPQANNVDYAYYMRAMSSFVEERSFGEKYFDIDLSQRDLADSHQAYDEFNQLVTQYPNSPYVPDALQRMVYLRNMFAEHEINIAQFYYDRQAYVAAVNRCYNVLLNYQQSPQVADALLIMVESYHKLGLDDASQNALNTLALNFPNSEQYKKAEGVLPKEQKPWYKFW